MFQKSAASALALSAETGPDWQSPMLEMGYVVALLAVFFIGVGLVMYFARADKATANMQPDPIPAKELKGARLEGRGNWRVRARGRARTVRGFGRVRLPTSNPLAPPRGHLISNRRSGTPALAPQSPTWARVCSETCTRGRPSRWCLEM